LGQAGKDEVAGPGEGRDEKKTEVSQLSFNQERRANDLARDGEYARALQFGKGKSKKNAPPKKNRGGRLKKL